MCKVILNSVLNTLSVSISHDTRGHDGLQSVYFQLSHSASQNQDPLLRHISGLQDLSRITITSNLSQFKGPLVGISSFQFEELPRTTLALSLLCFLRQTLYDAIASLESPMLSKEMLPFSRY